MMQKMIRWIFYFLIFTVPLVMYSGTSELFEFNKMVLIYLVSTLIFTLFLMDRIITPRQLTAVSIMTIVYLVFLLTQILSTVTSIDIHTSLFGYYGRFNGGLLSIITYIGLYFVFVNVFDRPAAIRFLRISLFSSLAVILWGMPGRFGHDLTCLVFTGQFDNTCWTNQFQPAVRMFSTLGQPNWLGAYLIIHFCIGLFFLFRNKLNKLNPALIFYWLYLILNFAAILFTRSRSSLMAAAICFGLFALPILLRNLLAFNYIAQKKRSAEGVQGKTEGDFVKLLNKFKISNLYSTGKLLLVSISLLICYLVANFQVPSFIQSSTTQAIAQPQVAAAVPAPTGVTDSFDIRKIVWQGALALGLQYPLLGTGVETFAYSYYFTRPQAHNLTSEWDFLYNKAHNEYLNYFATTGIPGTLAYFVLIAFALYLFLKAFLNTHQDNQEEKLLYLALTLAYASILITNLFGFSITVINLFFYLLPGFAIIIGRPAPQPAKPAPAAPGNISFYSRVQIALVLLLGTAFFAATIRYYMADLDYARAENVARIGDYGNAVLLLQNALSLHNEHVYEDRFSYDLANLAFIASYQKEATPSAKIKDGDADATSRYVKLARFFNQKSLSESPKNVLYYKTTSKNDYLFYQISLEPKYLLDATDALSTARKLAPTDPKIPYTIALFYSLLSDGNYPQVTLAQYRSLSLTAVEDSIRLKNDYRDGYFLKGQLLKKYGRTDEAKRTFEYVLKTFGPHDKEVLDELRK